MPCRPSRRSTLTDCSDRSGAVVHRRKQMRVEVDHAPGRGRSTEVANSSRLAGRRLRLRQQRERDQRVRGEEVESHRAVAGMGETLSSAGSAARQASATGDGRGRGGSAYSPDPGAERRRRLTGVPVQPVEPALSAAASAAIAEPGRHQLRGGRARGGQPRRVARPGRGKVRPARLPSRR